MSVLQLRSVTVVAMLVALAGCGSSHSRFESYMARGKQYLAADNLEKASIEFRNALQIEPRNGEAFYFNGRVAERRGNIREAVEFYQAAIDFVPDDIRARASLAKAYVLGGAEVRALEIIAPALLEHPDDPDLLAARAAARHQLRDDTEARNDAEAAVRSAPTNENAIEVLSALALRAGDTARAIALVSDAVTKAPDSVDLRRILASVYLTAAQPRQAEEQMRKIIALEPHELLPRMQLAAHFAQTHEPGEAQRVLEQAVQDLPNTDSAKLALVDFVTTQRSRAAGEKILRDFLARDPDDEDLRLALGTLLQRADATKEALATYSDIVRRDGSGPKGLAARDRIAAIQMSLGHEDEARKLVEEVLAQSPNDDDALIIRANIALAHDDPTNAIVDLRAALRDQPKSVILHRSLARAYLAQHEPAMAEEALRAAKEGVPDDVSIRIDLAQVMIQTDRSSQAVTLLEETIQKAPDDPQVREALVHAYLANHDLAAARKVAEELKTLRPNAPEGYYLAGLIAHEEHRPDDSEKNLERAFELQPASLDILGSLTRFSLERGRNADAIERLRRALDRTPDNLQILELLGGTYLETRDFGHATEILTRAVALAPRSWVAYRDLAQVKLQSNDTSGAIEEYLTALKVAPTEPRVVTELATLYEKQGRIDEAIACYETLYKRGPAAQELAANNLAMLLVTYRTDTASLDRARALTARFELSNNPAFLDTTGWVLFKRREYPEAVAVLGRASDRSPDSRVIRYHLGMAQLKVGQRESARANLEAALAGSGSFSGSDEARSALASLKSARSG
jgi:predicted Zn-dependent protease